MDATLDTRQQKFRAKMQDEGKKQRTFFLSDAAMGAIKTRKEITQAPSLNHALESWLVEQNSSEGLTQIQYQILDAAMRLAGANRKLKSIPQDHPDRAKIVEEFRGIVVEITDLSTT
jgi:hypothetical protein